MNNDFMLVAVKNANRALKVGEVPIGAVLVKNGKIVASGYNRKEKSNKITAHAEIICIEKAEKKFRNWRLDGCDLYVTLDPCPMCAGAIKQARIKNVYTCLPNLDAGNIDIISSIFAADNVNNSVNLIRMSDDYGIKLLIQKFFKLRRFFNMKHLYKKKYLSGNNY